MTAAPIRVLLVDDHPLVRDGVRMRLQATAHISVAGEASGVDEAIDLADALQPDLVLTDIRMPDATGIHLATVFRQRFPQIRVVVLSMHCDQEYVRRAVDLGVRPAGEGPRERAGPRVGSDAVVRAAQHESLRAKFH